MLPTPGPDPAQQYLSSQQLWETPYKLPWSTCKELCIIQSVSNVRAIKS